MRIGHYCQVVARAGNTEELRINGSRKSGKTRQKTPMGLARFGARLVLPGLGGPTAQTPEALAKQGTPHVGKSSVVLGESSQPAWLTSELAGLTTNA